jgi:photosystem II stability/assembly factor-like uncharacterized protein
MKIDKTILTIVFLGILIFGAKLFAGQLIPTGLPGSTFVSLSDIYQKILNNTYTTSTREFIPTTTPAGTGFTLQNIFDAIPTINPDKIISGNTILGVAGTYDISNLTPDKVATGTIYGLGQVGTKIVCSSGYHESNGVCSNTYTYSMSSWDRKYSDDETLPGGVYYPFASQYAYGHPLAFDNSGKMYAGYYRGYIYSTDEGQTWTMVDLSKKINQSTKWTYINVSSDGQKIWVSVRGVGVYVSNDAGSTFNFENQLAGLDLSGELRVLQSPYHSNHLIIFTSHDTGYGRRAGQIYRSIDSGSTWQNLSTAISNAGSVGPSAATPVAFDPDDSNTFYFISMISSNNAGLYVTTDGGTSFSRISGSTSYASSVGVSNDGNGKRLIISGACVVPTHTSVSNISWVGVGGANSYCGYDSTISVHPLNQDEVYIWNKGGYSLDGGKTVQEPSWPISSPDSIFSIVFAEPFQAHTFFVGSYYGKILKSTNGGASWTITGAMPYSQ